VTATLSPVKSGRYDLIWEAYWQWEGEPEVGGIYSHSVHFEALGDYKFEVSFRVGENQYLGILFVEVVITEPDRYVTRRNYYLGQFYTNAGAKKFAQFALNHFIETETWAVCPSFQPVDYINGEPYTMNGDEIVSEII
jgi:hypothetical protein